MSSTSNGLSGVLFRAPGARARVLGVAVLRVTVGVIFIAHGAQKFFMFGIPAVTDGFAQSGIPMASFMAPFIASVELLAGVALVAGFLTRLAALGTAFTMLGAMFLVHMKGGFFLPAGVEYTVVLLAASVTLILMGAGGFSLDSRFERRVVSLESAAGRSGRRRAA